MEGRLVSEDTVALAQAGGTRDWESVTPWSFPDPVAPPVAARRQGVKLALPELTAAVQRLSRANKPVLVEGVGGLLCPLTEDATVADLIAAVGLRLVVVARRSLGTLNHTLLTVDVARRRGLGVAGIVVNETSPPAGLADATNVDELRRLLPVPVLAVVPHQPSPRPGPLPELAAVPWWRLCFAGHPPEEGAEAYLRLGAERGA
jgi:dethiobiotin synthetase